MSEVTDKQIRKILDSDFWLPTLDTRTNYSRLHDDHDGTFEGVVSVMFGPDGDAYITTDRHVGPSLRFRMPLVGGGMSKRTRNALLILAEAIRLDNEDHPTKPT